MSIKLVELNIVDSICPETVRQTLKKTNLSRGSASNGPFRFMNGLPTPMPSLSVKWKTCSTSISDPAIRADRLSRWTKP